MNGVLGRLFVGLFLCAAPLAAEEPLRIGHFPTVTHAQAVIAHQLTREAQGWFEKALGTNVEWYVYNAGPSAMEALIAGSIDIAYVGPNPALNAFIRSGGNALKVIAGSARGGSALVVRRDGGFADAKAFRGGRMATPQLGNTQDVSARFWLQAAGLKVTQTGGDVQVIPTANPDQLSLFMRGKLDGAWTVEPWVSRLELEGNGVILLEEPEAVTTIVVASAKAIAERRELLTKFLRAHAELTDWTRAHPEQAHELLQRGIKADTSQAISTELLTRSLSRITFDTNMKAEELQQVLQKAQAVGFLRDAGDISGMIEGLS